MKALARAGSVNFSYAAVGILYLRQMSCRYVTHCGAGFAVPDSTQRKLGHAKHLHKRFGALQLSSLGAGAPRKYAGGLPAQK
jgi:hypothetical protein